MNICENCHSPRGDLYCDNCGYDEPYVQEDHYTQDDFGGYSDCDGELTSEYDE